MNQQVSIVLAAALMSIAAAVVAAGDAARGQRLYDSRCIACHSFDQIGPAHQGVFGRRAGQVAVAGCDHSAALKASEVVWAEQTLDAWLADPERAIAGQKIGYTVTDATDRTDLIAYLKKISPP